MWLEAFTHDMPHLVQATTITPNMSELFCNVEVTAYGQEIKTSNSQTFLDHSHKWYLFCHGTLSQTIHNIKCIYMYADTYQF